MQKLLTDFQMHKDSIRQILIGMLDDLSKEDFKLVISNMLYDHDLTKAYNVINSQHKTMKIREAKK
jgi:hypothetical protein